MVEEEKDAILHDVEEEEEEEEVIVVQRRGRKPKMARRASAKPVIELPSFLRYRNALMASKK
jgi:hypothetical protein